MAFPDEPEVEAYLKVWLAPGRDWTDIPNDAFLSNLSVAPQSKMGAVVNPDNSFLTDDVGISQVLFEDSPRSLLFVFGGYRFSTSTLTHSYDLLATTPFRWEISPLFYEADKYPVEYIWNAIKHLDRDGATQTDIQNILALLSSYESRLQQAMDRKDPYSIISPALSGLARDLQQKTADLQRQIVALSIGQSDVLPSSAYYTKLEDDALLAQKANVGDLLSLASAKANVVDLDNHALQRNAHGTTHVDVNAPSYDEFYDLESRISRIEFDDQDFSWDGDLEQIDNAARWYPWDPVMLLAVRCSLNVPPIGDSVVLDLLKDGVSIFNSPDDRPTIAEGDETVLVQLNNAVEILPGSNLSVSIIQVGTQRAGADLFIQVRYSYKEIYQTGIQMRYGKVVRAAGRSYAKINPNIKPNTAAKAVARGASSTAKLKRPVHASAKSVDRPRVKSHL